MRRIKNYTGNRGNEYKENRRFQNRESRCEILREGFRHRVEGKKASGAFIRAFTECQVCAKG